MAQIDILLAAYNGEKFIAEQIDSILAQTFQDFRLVIRDDGSNDKTPEIIEDYANKYPDKIQVIHDDAVCKHPTKNFFQLMKYAQADYVMFSDQDDYWLPYKVQITLDYMKKAERDNPNKPVLIFTGLQIVDENLKSMDDLMSLDFPESRYTFMELLPCNCAAGCTQMMNRECYSNLGEFHENIRLHDWWTILYAAAFGVVIRVPMALILYRQHGNNAIGASIDRPQVGEGGILKKIASVLRLITRPVRKVKSIIHKAWYMRGQNEFFKTSYSDKMSNERLSELNEYLELFSDSIITRFRAMRKLRNLYQFEHYIGRISRLLLVLFGNRKEK
ncbi:MAG: glycosyltransferase family 2 protein [Synergistaceae bacterium]|nr:glycosyltransferase family 2 protein [Synergistaceae bacterium]